MQTAELNIFISQVERIIYEMRLARRPDFASVLCFRPRYCFVFLCR